MKKARKWVAALTVCAMAFTLQLVAAARCEKDANAGRRTCCNETGDNCK